MKVKFTSVPNLKDLSVPEVEGWLTSKGEELIGMSELDLEVVWVSGRDRTVLVGRKGSGEKWVQGEVVGKDAERIAWNEKYRQPREEEEEGGLEGEGEAE